MPGEDIYFLYSYILCAASAEYLAVPVYHYTMLESSVMHQPSASFYIGLGQAHREMQSLFAAKDAMWAFDLIVDQILQSHLCGMADSRLMSQNDIAASLPYWQWLFAFEKAQDTLCASPVAAALWPFIETQDWQAAAAACARLPRYETRKAKRKTSLRAGKNTRVFTKYAGRHAQFAHLAHDSPWKARTKMKLWYCTLAHFGSADCDAAIKAAAEKYTPLFDLTVLCPCDSWQTSEQYGAIVQGFCADNAALKNALCEEFVRSYQAQLAIRALCAKSGMPDAIVFPACDAYGYYTVLYSYLDSFLREVPNLFSAFETEKDQAPPYLLPHWWINQQNDFCARFARGIVNESAADFAKAVALNAQTPFAPSACLQRIACKPTAPQLENEQKGFCPSLFRTIIWGAPCPKHLQAPLPASILALRLFFD